MVHSLRRCFRANFINAGNRAIVPSSFMISQITPMGRDPASVTRSTAASVWPARCNTPPGLARNGNTCPGYTRSSGTAVGDAIGLGIKMFEASQAPQKVMIVLTDGNDTASKMPPARAADIARDRRVTVHTVGIGDPQASGEDKLDIDTLRKVAQATGGQYFFAGDAGELEKIYATLDRITPHDHKTLSWRPRRELFAWPLGAALSVTTMVIVSLMAAATVLLIRAAGRLAR